MQLSAGQEQLLALTRALVSRPAVLLFDEATSFLDGASEAALRVALRATVLKRGAAMLTVAHRLSTAREAHRVVVLDHGRIVEDGAPTRSHRTRRALRGAAGIGGGGLGLACGDLNPATQTTASPVIR